MNKDLPRIKMNDTKAGQFIMTITLNTVIEMVRSGDVTSSMSPDTPMMKIYWSRNKDWSKGQLTQDYFNEEYFGPFNKEQADDFIKLLEAP